MTNVSNNFSLESTMMSYRGKGEIKLNMNNVQQGQVIKEGNKTVNTIVSDDSELCYIDLGNDGTIDSVVFKYKHGDYSKQHTLIDTNRDGKLDQYVEEQWDKTNYYTNCKFTDFGNNGQDDILEYDDDANGTYEVEIHKREDGNLDCALVDTTGDGKFDEKYFNPDNIRSKNSFDIKIDLNTGKTTAAKDLAGWSTSYVHSRGYDSNTWYNQLQKWSK